MRPTDLLKAKDAMIRFRAPSEVAKKLKIDAARLSITASRLALGVLTIFLVLESTEQKSLLEGKGAVSVKHVSTEWEKGKSRKRDKGTKEYVGGVAMGVDIGLVLSSGRYLW